MNAQSRTDTANAVAVVEPKKSLIVEMASRYGMEPTPFQQTLKATVFPPTGTVEEFAAFLVVCREYNLNPLTKEIYAFPKKGGGLQPIVSIDGWLNIINSRAELDGIEFDDHFDEQKKLTAITARIWRKDRAHPIIVTEYLSECKRDTDPWRQYPHRMLRHKALIQCARYSFGFAGVVDPDEAERMGVDVSDMKPSNGSRGGPPTPPSPPASRPSAPPAPPSQPIIDADVELVTAGAHDPQTGEVVWEDEQAAAPALTRADLVQGINKLNTVRDCDRWIDEHQGPIEALDDADAREVNRTFNSKRAALNRAELVNAG